MSDFVRVSLPNGHEVTLSQAFAQGEGLEVLDAPATNLRGEPLPATRKNGRRMKPKTTVKKEAAKRAAESDSGPSDDTTPGGSPAESAEEANQWQ